jgi:hypothetical protein
MTQDEIIELARQAGFDIGMWEKLSDDDDVFGYGIDGTHENLEAFAKLVAEKEREACANICETLELPDWPDKVRQPLAQAIRARGENK